MAEMTQQEMMENWMKNATPGAQHERMAKECGEYSVAMDEGGKTMSGDVKMEMILGGRVQLQRFTMDYQGMPFEGAGMMGYDNFTQRYWFTWNDNMSTGLFTLWGKEQDGGKKIVFEGAMDSPGMNMRDVPTRHMYTYLNENEFMYQAWIFPGTAQEKKTMEMHYKRK
ncbi:MAG: DUF1579 family protein [Calditrichaeota bacterium]|nr:DUF1579 family protein [Calditrichota bacterium]MCB9369087.1 DUF1579 family protein [Calditrichota bacterium]